MHIRYVDGRRFGRALAAGARRLVESAGFLDRINVFPVPDGDTRLLVAALSARYRLDGPIAITTVSPALATHGGLGIVVLGFLVPESQPC